MTFLTITAFALSQGQVLFSYNGSGICDKGAVGSFGFKNAGNGITVNHSNTSWTTSSGTRDMTISVTKKGVLGYSTYNNQSFTISGVNSGSKDFWINDAGTYSLYFRSSNLAYKANIDGNMSWRYGAE